MLSKMPLFRKRRTEESLSAHADSLLGAHENFGERNKRLDPLHNVAQGVRDALTPVDPEATFVAELRQRLSDTLGEHLTRRAKRREKREMALRIAGIAGLMISGLAMVALGVRFILGFVARRRRVTPLTS